MWHLIVPQASSTSQNIVRTQISEIWAVVWMASPFWSPFNMSLFLFWVLNMEKSSCSKTKERGDISNKVIPQWVELVLELVWVDRWGSLFQHTAAVVSAKSYMCPVCGRALSSPGSLGRHLLIHSEDQRSNCAVCGARFTSHATFNRLAGHLNLYAGSRLLGVGSPFPVKDLALQRQLTLDSGNTRKEANKYVHSVKTPPKGNEFSCVSSIRISSSRKGCGEVQEPSW